MTEAPLTNAELAAENLRVGSESLVASALAYLAYGLDFEGVSVDEFGGGGVSVADRRVVPLVNSCVSLAGLVVELRWDADREGLAEAIPARIALWTEMALSSETSSVHNIDAKYVLEALVWALAFVEANATLIAANGIRLRDAGGSLDYSDLVGQSELIVIPTGEQRKQYSRIVLPYAPQLFAIGFANTARTGQLD